MSLKVGLALQSESHRFPDDREFQGQLREQDLYGKRVCRVILERLENHDTKEPTDTQGLSIEHIMPQNENLSVEWREMIGRDDTWRAVQEEWLHRLGNLTLTAYNTEYSDRSFAEKRAYSGGFEDSAVRLNKFVREQDVWTEDQMKRRGILLSERALEVWPALRVSPELLEAAKEAELKRRAERGNADDIPMSDHARELFHLVSEQTRKLGGGVVEIAERHSVSYHAPEFFMEVLPRKYRLVLLLSPEVAEIEDDERIAMDATRWKYFRGSRYRGGVALYVDEPGDIDRAMRLVLQALVITTG